jgi:hypothetical protein
MTRGVIGKIFRVILCRIQRPAILSNSFRENHVLSRIEIKRSSTSTKQLSPSLAPGHLPLPEFQSLPRVWFCAESQMKNSRQIKFKKSLGKQTSSPRAKQKALGTKKTFVKDFFTKSQTKNSRQRKFKNHFFASNFFLSSTYTHTKLMLKFGIISTLFKNFTSF